jgi:hypothetical protein
MQAVILDASDGKDSELSPSSESDATCQATEDEDYYLYFVTFEVKEKVKSSSEEISNTMIFFQVEDRLFRVPSYQFFDESPEFVEIYKLSTHLRADDGEPIKLEMVTQEDFRSLLKVLYPL